MFDSLSKLFLGRSDWEIARDLLDVAIVAYLIYRLLLIVRGTRAMQMGVGLGVILLLYLASKSAGLVTLQSLLSYVLSSIILIVIVVFQNDIRRALIRVGGQAWLGRGRRQQEQSRVIDEAVAAVTELARHRIGAIIAFEQDASLLEFTKSEGVIIGASVTRELLVALFYPESVNKLHDGAIIIRDLKIARAGVFFPMPDTKMLDSSMGSRHRAALGITEETDAVVVVVSEERGTISICYNGNIVPNIDGTALRQTLVNLLENRPTKKRAIRAVAATERSSDRTSGPSSPRSSRADSIPPSTPSPLATSRAGDGLKGRAAEALETLRETIPIAATTSPLPATATPLPVGHAARLERARAEAAHSAEEALPHAKGVAQPMRRMSPPKTAMIDDEESDAEDRQSFVPSSRETIVPRSGDT